MMTRLWIFVIVLFITSVLAALFRAFNAQFNMLPPVVINFTSAILLPHCDIIVRPKRPPAARHRTPPWIRLLNDKESRSKALYVRADRAEKLRLGNQLFIYASLFGIAWSNNRVPVWPDGQTQLRTAFRIRIPIDRHNAIINVSIKHLLRQINCFLNKIVLKEHGVCPLHIYSLKLTLYS